MESLGCVRTKKQQLYMQNIGKTWVKRMREGVRNQACRGRQLKQVRRAVETWRHYEETLVWADTQVEVSCQDSVTQTQH